MAAVELRIYQTRHGKKPFADWLQGLADRQARSRIQARLARVALGNFGDARSVGSGVMELRIDWGPGYRAYFGRQGRIVVILLCGGDKRTQQRDIADAKEYFRDYQQRA